MPLIKAQCTNCGATLEVDNAKEAAICPFCNSAYIVEKAINQYTINNKFNIENASINITSGSIEEELDKAETYLYKLHNLQKAAKIYEAITEKYPGDYRGWWGEVIAITDNLTLYADKQDDLNEIAYLAQNALAVVPSGKSNNIKQKWSTFYTISSKCIEIHIKNEVIKTKKQEIKSLEEKIAHDQSNSSGCGMVATGILFILLGIVIIWAVCFVDFHIFPIILALCPVAFGVYLTSGPAMIRKEINKEIQQLSNKKSKLAILQNELATLQKEVESHKQ